MAPPVAGMPPRLTAEDLRRLPDPAATPADCACKHLRCAGWESVPAPLGEPLLQRLGTLRDAADADGAEPTVQELHADGSRYASPHAPIAPAWFPYNRCEVWACRACGRGFLQYTEFGGYYVDHRLREVDPGRVVD
ncbi:MAG: hypothetical protein Q7U73_21155 [Rubrivivax sp.]|nr:hypothetical protein [Rubrivivax sp.]